MNLNDHLRGVPEAPPQTFHPRFLRHIKSPHNIGIIEEADGQATGVGTCGDSMQVFLRICGNTVTNIRCRYEGCQYTLACASAMSKLVLGRTLSQTLELEPSDVASELGGLPADHLHCARLAVNTLGEAIDDYYQKRW
jgi:nitrogen fixation protein NifU and related proteins